MRHFRFPHGFPFRHVMDMLRHMIMGDGSTARSGGKRDEQKGQHKKRETKGDHRRTWISDYLDGTETRAAAS